MLLFITWNFDPEIISLPMLSPRWYGLLFALTFYFGYILLRKVWLREKLPEEKLDTLSWYVIIATLLGARLGHVFFYGPYWDVIDTAGNVIQRGYLDNPLSILNIREGGLASHGATIGVLLGLYLFKRITKFDKSFLWIVDRLVIVVALGAALVRIGNFANSEIIGKPTDAPYGVVFAHNSLNYLDYVIDQEEGSGLQSYSFNRIEGDSIIDGKLYAKYDLSLVYKGPEGYFKGLLFQSLPQALNSSDPADQHTYYAAQKNVEIKDENGLLTASVIVYGLPRHPAQLYESICYLVLFLILWFFYRRDGVNIKEGLLFGIFLTVLFTARFFIEFIKENQVAFEDQLTLNMGQNLSIPFVLIGIGLIVYSQVKGKPKAG